jgi:two-component system chemotaxis response regulator CheB
MLRTKLGGIRVVVVDDSPSARELLVALLQSSEGIQVVGVASNGVDAIRLTKRLCPDVVTMDIVMPRMDGLEAIRQIMRKVPTPIVIVTAHMMRAGMDMTFEGLQAGALTVLRKPGLADPETCAEIVRSVRLMAEVPVVHHWGRADRTLKSGQLSPPQPVQVTTLLSKDLEDYRGVRVVGIASSTGGPATLAQVLKPLPADFHMPILVVQHITRGFASGLAEWLDGETALQVDIAGHGEEPRPGQVLLAPDDYHMRVNERKAIELSKEPPYKGLRPSANHLFRSLARTHGSRAVGIVLTGMGDDGAEGLESLYLSGGLTMAQDEESSVVYGMPCEAVKRNAVDQVLPPDEIASALQRLDALQRLGKAVHNE